MVADRHDDDEPDGTHRTDYARQHKEQDKDKDRGTKDTVQKKKKLEPSLKWKALGVEEYKE